MKYFDNDLYDLLINQEKNYIFVEIQNKNHDLYKVTIRFIHDFHFQCSCGKCVVSTSNTFVFYYVTNIIRQFTVITTIFIKNLNHSYIFLWKVQKM